MIYRYATSADLPAIQQLQHKFHAASVTAEERADGYVGTLLPDEALLWLIRGGGIILADDDGQLAGYVMAGPWDFWTAWPLFQHLWQNLPDCDRRGNPVDAANSFKYGPIVVDGDYRGLGVFSQLFEHAMSVMGQCGYREMVSLINKENPRSFAAHTRKAGCGVLSEMTYNGVDYWVIHKTLEVPDAVADPADAFGEWIWEF